MNGKVWNLVTGIVAAIAIAALTAAANTWRQVGTMDTRLATVEHHEDTNQKDHDSIIKIESELEHVRDEVEKNKTANKEAHDQILEQLKKIERKIDQ